jgi:hypothetical protein
MYPEITIDIQEFISIIEKYNIGNIKPNKIR